MKKIIIILVLVAGAIGGGIGFYLFNKKVESLKEMKPDFTLSSEELYSAFEQNDSLAFRQYKDKVVEASGEIEKIVNVNDSNNTVLLKASAMGNIKCSMDPSENANLKGYDSGSQITVKCICTGKNKMEELGLVIIDVELARCVIQSGK